MLDFRPHKYALLFPPMGEKELDDLAADIKEKKGVVNPIVLLDGEILDGVQRFTACKRAGIEARFVNWVDFPESVKQIGPLAYVYSQNIPRRHLTTKQRTEHALKLLPLLKEEAKQRQLAALKKGNERPVGVNDTNGKGKATAIAAKMAGVSTSTVERALRSEREEYDGESATDEPSAPDAELHFREVAKDVRDMISKVLRSTDWDFSQRAWLCSKAATKLAALARELSKHEKDETEA